MQNSCPSQFYSSREECGIKMRAHVRYKTQQFIKRIVIKPGLLLLQTRCIVVNVYRDYHVMIRSLGIRTVVPSDELYANTVLLFYYTN